VPPRDPSAVQIDSPELVARLIRDLSLIGQVGLLNLAPEVRPVYLVGDAGITLAVAGVIFEPGEVIDGFDSSMVAGQVLVDTGQLLAGTFDCQFWLSASLETGVNSSALILEHRNAANDANVSRWALPVVDNHTNAMMLDVSLVVAANERFRVVNNVISTGSHAATIMFKRRIAL